MRALGWILLMAAVGASMIFTFFLIGVVAGRASAERLIAPIGATIAASILGLWVGGISLGEPRLHVLVSVGAILSTWLAALAFVAIIAAAAIHRAIPPAEASVEAMLVALIGGAFFIVSWWFGRRV